MMIQHRLLSYCLPVSPIAATSRLLLFFSLLAASLTPACLVAQSVDQATRLTNAEEIDFSRDIRPILSDACFHCHGPDEAKRESGLRLDSREGLFGDLGGYSPVLPHNADASEVIRRIESSEPSELMPPPESNKSLTADQKQLLRKWIESGAEWEQHWGFVAPVKTTPPNVSQSDWCKNELDNFILDRLDQAKLSPSPTADPATLIRRLYLDLIGLPPSPEQARHWESKIWGPPENVDTTPQIDEDAYQELVTELLSSPHYGERWARRWLDLARYADTNGYEKDRDRSIWPYRDWVINALNQDMPFDQFTVEQLAGDMLPDASREQLIATGFHRNTMLNEEGGIDPLEFRYHAMTDRVATTGTTWLGLTLGCCQCHTHKYDPISHTEYFQVMALLNNADEPTLELPNDDYEKTWSKNRKQAKRQLNELASQWPVPKPEAESEERSQEERQALRQSAFENAFAAWLTEEELRARNWETLAPTKATSSLPILTIQPDASIFASGDTAKRDDYYIELSGSETPIEAIELEALPDERLPERGPGTTYYEGTRGDFYLTEIEFSGQSPSSEHNQTFPVSTASDSYSKNRFGNRPANASLAIDGDIQTGWSVHDRQGERHVAVFVFEPPIPAHTPLAVHMSFGRHFASSLGRFRFRASKPASPEQPGAEIESEHPVARDFDDATWASLLRPAAERSADDRQRLREAFLLRSPELAKEAQAIRQLLARPRSTTTLIMSERPGGEERPTFRHHRGEYLQAEEQVEPDVPDVLPPLDEKLEPNRLAFSRWLVARKNPLTARVVVNRHWQAFFGTGIVKTLDDFGLQGAPPSHPELLDYLAVYFMDEAKWSLKQLHRFIVSSATYRQSSEVSENMLTQDPSNRLLSCMPRFRLDAEILRDSLLVVSGTLNPQLGGPPVRPLQPAGVTEVAYGSPKWNASAGENRYRRSIYTFIKRTAPFAMFTTFDAPSGEACIAQRDRSNSPLQALTLLNDIMLLDLARATGKRYAHLGSKPRGDKRAPNSESDSLELQNRIRQLFKATLTRTPTSAEAESLTNFFDAQLAHFQTHPELAAKLLDREVAVEKPDALAQKTGVTEDIDASPSKPSDGKNESQLSDANAIAEANESLAEEAAWTALARALFAVDEFLVRN